MDDFVKDKEKSNPCLLATTAFEQEPKLKKKKTIDKSQMIKIQFFCVTKIKTKLCYINIQTLLL